MNRPFSWRAGFTLLEVIAVTAIMGVLLAIGTSSYLAYQQKLQLDQAMQETASFINNMREKSLSHSAEYTLTYNTSTQVLSWKDSSLNTVRTLGLAPAKFVAWPENLVFRSRGLPVKQYSLTLERAGKQRNLHVLTTGKVILR